MDAILNNKLSSRFTDVKFYDKDQNGNVGKLCTAENAKFFVLPGTSGRATILPASNEREWYKWLGRLTAAADGQFDAWTLTNHPVQTGSYLQVPAELGEVSNWSRTRGVLTLSYDTKAGSWVEVHDGYITPCEPRRSEWHSAFNELLGGNTIILSTFGHKANYLQTVVQNWKAGPGNVQVEADEDIAASKIRATIYQATQSLIGNGLMEAPAKEEEAEMFPVTSVDGAVVNMLTVGPGVYKIVTASTGTENTSLPWSNDALLVDMYKEAWSGVSKSNGTMLVDVLNPSPLQ